MKYSRRFNSQDFVTLLGVETAGKTTVSDALAKKFGGHALRVPTWPSLENFLTSPSKYALANQTEAMEYTLSAKRRALESQPLPLFADNSPDRIHLVHSWQLREEGLLTCEDWKELEEQYNRGRDEWSSYYIYLRVKQSTMIERLEQRGRPEDLEYNLRAAAALLERWEDVIADNQWRENKKILEVSGEIPLEEIYQKTESWIKRQISNRED